MKLNLKVRLKNKVFWITLVPALITVIYALLSLFDIVPAIAEETAVKGFYAVISILTVLGVVIDPTTKGVGDSERAMSYERPFEDSAEDGGEADG